MNEFVLNPDSVKKLRDGVVEASNCLTRIEDQREAMKGIVEMLSRDTGIDKKVLNQVVKAHHTRKFDEIQHIHDRFEYVYESVVGAKSE